MYEVAKANKTKPSKITIIAAPAALFTFLNFFLCFNFFLSHMGREMGAVDEGVGLGWVPPFYIFFTIFKLLCPSI